jgi:hypothetical protein
VLGSGIVGWRRFQTSIRLHWLAMLWTAPLGVLICWLKSPEKNNSRAPNLLQLYKFDDIVAKIVARICIRLALAVKSSFLLMVCGDALRVGRLCTDLVR